MATEIISKRRSLPVTSITYTDEKHILYDKQEKPYRLTNFIVTLGEGTLTSIDIQNFIELGLHIIRFKMSNVTRSDKIKLLAMLKSAVKCACKKYDVSTWPIAISIDLPNASIRTGVLREDIGDRLELKDNSVVEITSNIKYCDKCCAEKIYIDDAKTLSVIKPGQEITIIFGEIILICTEVFSRSINCIVVKGGVLGNRDHVIFRGITNLKQDLSSIDMELVEFAIEFQLDIVTINYVRHSNVVQRVRNLFPVQSTPLIISTICDQRGLENINDIIQVSDGIILAREFLAPQIENKFGMPSIQLNISGKCQQAGKPFFISGNLHEETIITGKVSHNELSDITNTVYQKTGFVLRNYHEAENLVKSLRVLDSMCRYIESNHRTDFAWKVSTEIDIPVTAAEACLSGCIISAKQLGARAIVLVTVTGRTAARLSLLAPDAIVLAVTGIPAVARRLRFYRGLIPIIYDKEHKDDWYEEMTTRIKFAVSYGIKNEMLKYGETFVALRKSCPTSAFADNISIWTVTIPEDQGRYIPCTPMDDKLDIRQCR